MCTQFRFGYRDGKRPLGKPRRSWEGSIRMVVKKIGWTVWTGFMWLRIGTGGSLRIGTVGGLDSCGSG
jgi:hypothetical protein